MKKKVKLRFSNWKFLYISKKKNNFSLIILVLRYTPASTESISRDHPHIAGKLRDSSYGRIWIMVSSHGLTRVLSSLTPSLLTTESVWPFMWPDQRPCRTRHEITRWRSVIPYLLDRHQISIVSMIKRCHSVLESIWIDDWLDHSKVYIVSNSKTSSLR